MSAQEHERERRVAGADPKARRRWRLGPIIVIGGFVVFAALSSSIVAWHAPAPPSDLSPPLGYQAPDFTLPLFSGGTLSLHSLMGKPVVLNFWASWCVPCRTETPLLVRMHRLYGPRGIAFVGVDVEDDEKDARAFIGQYHVDYAVVRSDEKIMTAYVTTGIPTTVFIRAEGVVVDKVAGGFLGPEGETSLRLRLGRLLQPAKP